MGPVAVAGLEKMLAKVPWLLGDVSLYPNSGDFEPSGNGLYGLCRVRDSLDQRIYVHSLGATNFFFAVSAEKMDFRGSEVGSSLKGTAFLSDAWRRVGTLLRPESSAVVCAGGFSHRS